MQMNFGFGNACVSAHLVCFVAGTGQGRQPVDADAIYVLVHGSSFLHETGVCADGGRSRGWRGVGGCRKPLHCSPW
jgi:hypothetical protein